MDKKELRNVLSGLTQGQEITVNFRNNHVEKNGAYQVLNVKKGKGKGGSLIAELRPVGGGESIVVGTPDSDNVLNVVVDGKLTGYESEEDVPLLIKPNGTRAAELKEVLKSMATGSQLQLESALLEEFNGVFTLNSVRPSKGRYGQVVAVLRTSSGSTVELWSYRHSGAIDSFSKI